MKYIVITVIGKNNIDKNKQALTKKKENEMK